MEDEKEETEERPPATRDVDRDDGKMEPEKEKVREPGPRPKPSDSDKKGARRVAGIILATIGAALILG